MGKRILASAVLVVATCTVALLGACTSSFDPADRVEVTLVATPVMIEQGDTVHLLGIAHNPTAQEVSAGVGCTPGIGFYVAGPSGEAVSLYDNLAFTCQVKDSNGLASEETDSVFFRWVPETVGLYQVRAALVSQAGPISPSASTPITVR